MVTGEGTRWMAPPRLAYAHYASLRDLDLTHEDVAGSWRLGHAASWARWGESTHDLAPITATDQDEFSVLAPLTTAVVLFAINWGGTTAPADLRDWTNFHTRGHRGDGTLKNSVRLAMAHLADRESRVPAPYLTDVFKLVPTPTSGELEQRIRDDAVRGIDHVGRCAAILESELTLCRLGAAGQAPVLVGMGSAATRWLQGRTGDPRIAEAVDRALGAGAHQRVRRMDHYTFGVGSNETRAASIVDALRRAGVGG